MVSFTTFVWDNSPHTFQTFCFGKSSFLRNVTSKFKQGFIKLKGYCYCFHDRGAPGPALKQPINHFLDIPLKKGGKQRHDRLPTTKGGLGPLTSIKNRCDKLYKLVGLNKKFSTNAYNFYLQQLWFSFTRLKSKVFFLDKKIQRN
jgi:hypothetical protein